MVECLRSDDIINCPNKIANTFGSYYAEIGNKLTDKIKTPRTVAKTYMGKINMNRKSLYLFPTTEREIELIIEKIPTKNSSVLTRLAIIFSKKLENQY